MSYPRHSGRQRPLLITFLTLLILAPLLHGQESTQQTSAGDSPSNSLEQEIDQFATLPYLHVSRDAPKKVGTTIYNRSLSYKGLNLYTSGGDDWTEVGIMDMKGNILHAWTYDMRDSWPRNREYQPIRRVHLMENGDIVVIFETLGLIRLDRLSRPVWALPGQYHHHLQEGLDGNIYVLFRERRTVQNAGQMKEVFEEFVSVISPDGKLLKRISIFDSFKKANHAHIVYSPSESPDIYHTNTLQIFDGSLAHLSPIFRKGNILLGIRNIKTVAILDPEEERIVWAMDGYKEGLWNIIHEPVLLSNGNILLFNNNGDDSSLKKSTVIEFNPLTKKIVWRYEGDEEHPFYSATCGTNQRLPNGNTLVAETHNGRAFEITPAGKIVWEYVATYRTKENKEKVAALYHMQRIDQDEVSWLK